MMRHSTKLSFLALVAYQWHTAAAGPGQNIPFTGLPGGCLSGAIAADKRHDFLVAETMMPVSMLSPSWDSGLLLGAMAGTILSERMGYNVVMGTGPTGSSGEWMMLADCLDLDSTKPCDPGPVGSGGHFALEVWDSYSTGMAEKITAEWPTRTPVIIGFPRGLGADGTEFMFVTDKPQKEAWEGDHLFLRWYQSYNVSWSKAYKYFAKHTDLPNPDFKCEDNWHLEGSYMETYVGMTGDTAAFTPGTDKHACTNEWALSPACRKLLASGETGCIPLVSYNGWGYPPFMQFAYWYEMPIAFGAFTWGQYLAMPTEYDVLFYWWTPDGAFAGRGVSEVVFPSYNADEHAQKIYKTAVAGGKIYKLANAAVTDESLLMQFFDAITISIQSIMSMVEALPTSTMGDDLKVADIACQWLQANRPVWEAWVPSKTSCVPKQGLVNAAGTFVKNLEEAEPDGACEFCSTGKFSSGITTDSGPNYVCLHCPRGTAQGALGQTECVSCAAGTFAISGASECMFCPKGSYSDMDGSANCTSCSSGFTTRDIASSAREACVCTEGHYMHGTCRTCPVGMICAAGSDYANFASSSKTDGLAGNDEKPYPVLMPLYWSSSSDPISVFTCASTDHCPGGVPGACPTQAEGQACARCAAGWVWEDDFGCKECADIEKTAMIFPILPVILMPLIVVSMYKLFGDTYARWGTWRNGIAAVGFISLNHYQIVSMLGNANLILPSNVLGAVDFFKFTTNVATIFNPGCAGHADFQSDLIMKTIAPALILATFVIVWLLSHLIGKFVPMLKMEKNRTFNAAMSLMFTFFAGICELALTLFKCGPNPNGTSSLVADRSIVCNEEDWTGMLAIGLVAVALWVVGIGGSFIWAVWKVPAQFTNIEIQMRWKFLFIKYRSDVHWWALVFVVKGFMLNLGYVILELGIEQIYWVMTILVVYTFGTVGFMPWRHRAVNAVDVWVHLCLIMICSVLTWFAKEGLETELDQLDRDLSILLIVITVMCVPVILPACGYMFMQQTTVKYAQSKRRQMVQFRQALTDAQCVLENEQKLYTVLGELHEWDFFNIIVATDIIQQEITCRNKTRSGLSDKQLSGTKDEPAAAAPANNAAPADDKPLTLNFVVV